MTKVLLPVDGSEFSDRALDYVLDMARGEVPLDLHLVNVQLAIDSGHARMFVSDDDIAAYHRDEGLAVLKPYRARLDAAGVSGGPCGAEHRAVREGAEVRPGRHGTHGRSGMTQLLMGSVAQNVIRRLKIPVALVK